MSTAVYSTLFGLVFSGGLLVNAASSGTQIIHMETGQLLGAWWCSAPPNQRCQDATEDFCPFDECHFEMACWGSEANPARLSCPGGIASWHTIDVYNHSEQGRWAGPADWNVDGVIDSRDMFGFLSAWFAGEADADFNISGATETTDLFAFLLAFNPPE